MVSRVTGDRRINQGLAPDVVMACCGNVRGLSDVEFEELFNRDQPVIFAFHGYPWLIHRVTTVARATTTSMSADTKEEGTIATPFDMTVLNALDRFHLVIDTVDRLPQTGDKGT